MSYLLFSYIAEVAGAIGAVAGTVEMVVSTGAAAALPVDVIAGEIGAGAVFASRVVVSTFFTGAFFLTTCFTIFTVFFTGAFDASPVVGVILTMSAIARVEAHNTIERIRAVFFKIFHPLMCR
jgi:hypothetical protein